MDRLIAILKSLRLTNRKVFFIGLLILLGLTNPSLEAHKDETIFEISPHMGDPEYYRNRISRRNFFLFSLTRANFPRSQQWRYKQYRTARVIGLGILGQVFIFEDAL